MPTQPPLSPLGAFLKALEEQDIRCILIGMMAAVQQGAPLMTIDYDFWVDLPERQYVRILAIIRRLGGTIMAPTFFELSDGVQVNVVFKPTGLRSFSVEYANSPVIDFEGREIRVLPLERIIASKKAAGREKDVAALPTLERALRISRQRSKTKQASKRSKPR
jgi:hypothetical protein